MISRGTVRYRSALAERVTVGDVRTQAWLRAATHAMLRAGSDEATAARRALKLLDIYVTRQASVLAYNHVYQLITAGFVLCLPLVLLLRRPRGHVEVEIGAE
jgi:DHA2 family multidrug resistance protein